MGRPSHILKLERAREHLAAFEIESRAWTETEPYGIVDEPDPEPPPDMVNYQCRNRRFRITFAPKFPDRFRVLIGDCLFNLRSSLDHLVLALAKRHLGSAITEDQIKRSQFPIFDSDSSYRDKAPRLIEGVAPAAQAVIEAIQPYQGGHDCAIHPLWRLNKLHNIDKHRELTVCAGASMRDGNFSFEAIEIGQEQRNFNWRPYHRMYPGALELDAIIYRWAAMPIDPNREVCMKPHLPLEVIFGEETVVPHYPVVPLLQDLCRVVGEEIMPHLAKFLEPGIISHGAPPALIFPPQTPRKR